MDAFILRLYASLLAVIKDKVLRNGLPSRIGTFNSSEIKKKKKMLEAEFLKKTFVEWQSVQFIFSRQSTYLVDFLHDAQNKHSTL